jgi:hypothetical protein
MTRLVGGIVRLVRKRDRITLIRLDGAVAASTSVSR